ncbi:MAG: MBL fold metallo-hydrolase [Clostridia bacterium]|nr:MBL fold metallo-hydrolase [Clostridia bacterium]
MLPADEAAFIIRFFNVGDGDSALMETVGKRPFRLLVDTGGSRKEMLRGGRGCVEYLRALRIECLDAVIITHLHMDHMGALTDITGNIPIRRVISGYFPPEDSGTVSCGPKAEKTVRGLTDCLNVWKEGTDLLRRQGCIFEEIRGSGPVAGLGTDLKMTCVLPDASGTERQKRAWDRMYRGEDVFEDEKAAVSRLRNPTSLVLRAEYAGRSVVMGADLFGALWEGWKDPPCDILKVPHHGDRKAMTTALAEALRPRHAVISCGAEYIPDKDRPSSETAAMLRKAGAKVWYTGAFEGDPFSPVRRWPWIEFRIGKNGCLSGPLTETGFSDLIGEHA